MIPVVAVGSMAKYYSGFSFFNFSWDQVANAFWERYPNPFATHVLTEDTVFREVRDGKLYSTRLLTKTNRIPKWGERFVPGAKFVSVVEESVVDPANKTLTTYTKNIGYTKLMMVEEKTVYKTSKADLTECHKEAWVSCQIPGFSRPVSAFGVERYKKNATKSAQGFQYVLQKLNPALQGVATVPALRGFNADKLKEISAEQAVRLKERARKATQLAKAHTLKPVIASCASQGNS